MNKPLNKMAVQATINGESTAFLCSPGQVLAEVGGNQIERFNPAADSNEPYPGPAGDFTLVPGEGYLVRVGSPSSFVPAHY